MILRSHSPGLEWGFLFYSQIHEDPEGFLVARGCGKSLEPSRHCGHVCDIIEPSSFSCSPATGFLVTLGPPSPGSSLRRGTAQPFLSDAAVQWGTHHFQDWLPSLSFQAGGIPFSITLWATYSFNTPAFLYRLGAREHPVWILC